MKTLRHMIAASAVLAFLAPVTSGAAERTTGWQPGFTLAPYIWNAGLDGTLGADGDDDDGSGLPPNLEVSTDEEWSQIGFMFYGEWRGERWTVFFDSVWANLSQEADIKLSRLLPDSDAEVTFDGNIYQLGVGYRVFESQKTFLTVFGGGRYYDVEAEIELKGGILPQKIATSRSRSWSDAVFGARLSHDFGQNWNASLLADYGSGDSESVWQVFGTMGYEFSWGSIVGGYRYMTVDYENSSQTIEMTLRGPVLGASFTF